MDNTQTDKPKLDKWDKIKRYGIILQTIIMIILIIVALVYGVLYAKSYYQKQAYQIGIKTGSEYVIGLQNQQAQWYYLIGNATNYTIQNISVSKLCENIKNG